MFGIPKTHGGTNGADTGRNRCGFPNCNLVFQHRNPRCGGCGKQRNLGVRHGDRMSQPPLQPLFRGGLT